VTAVLAPAVFAAPADHVFGTGAWLRAWERTDAERRLAARHLRFEDPDGFPAVAPVYLLEDSPMWRSYQTDAGVGQVFETPVAMTPSLYSFYGLAEPSHLDALLLQARLWDAGALVVGNVLEEWPEPTASLVLDKTYRADVSAGVDAHLAGMAGHARREFRREWRRTRERGVRLTVLHEAAMRPRLAEFAALARTTALRHGPSLYTLATFQAMSSVPGATLLLAEQDGVVVGGFLSFLYDDRLYLWAGGWDYSRRAELHTYSFLFYESIRFAVRHGCRYVEAGRGNFAFKEKLGFEPIELWSHVYLLREDAALEERLAAMRAGLDEFLGRTR
jgi:hypothetical protein